MRIAEQVRIRGIVLAGVHAWGGSPLERICPRPLLPVIGKPLMWYGLEWLRRGGIREATVCANSDTHALRSCLGDGSTLGLVLDYYEDVMPRGPAGCTRDAALQSDADLLVVVEGTSVPLVQLDSVLKAHQQSRSSLTMVAVEPSSTASSGTMEPAGIYVVSRSAVDLVPANGYQDIKETWVQRLYQQHDRPCVPHFVKAPAAVRVRNLGSYLRVTAHVLGSLAVEESLESEYRRIESAWVHRSAQVATSARFTAPALIGPRACIGRDVVVAGPVVISPGSRIGAGAVLSNVVVWSRCEVGAGAIVMNSVLLAGSRVEPGLVIRDAFYSSSSPPAGDDYWAMPLSS